MSILDTICDDMGILVRCLTDRDAQILSDGKVTTAKGSAWATKIPKKGYVILVDNEASKWEKRLMIAHELGHIISGHLSGSCVLDFEAQEQEARIFAGAFVALMLFKEYENAV